MFIVATGKRVEMFNILKKKTYEFEHNIESPDRINEVFPILSKERTIIKKFGILQKAHFHGENARRTLCE